MPTNEEIVDYHINEQMDQVLRYVTLQLWTSLVKYTPVDTGRARAGWSIQKGTPSTYTPPEVPVERTKTGRAKKLAYTQPKPPKLARSSPTSELTSYFVTNNVEYIEVLDQGRSERAGQMRGSAQAPYGMTILAINDLRRSLAGFRPTRRASGRFRRRRRRRR